MKKFIYLILCLSLLFLFTAYATETWIDGREYISTDELEFQYDERITQTSDDVIKIYGSGGIADTDLLIDLDGVGPVLYSATDGIITIDDDFTVTGNFIAGNQTNTGDYILDDNSGDSPSLIFKDESEKNATMTKVHNGVFNITTSHDDIRLNPGGSDVLLNGGLTVGSTTEAGNSNLRVEGTSALQGNVTIATGKNLTIGTTQWNSGDSIDGERIADNTIDIDSIDWGTSTGQISASDMPNEDVGDISISSGSWTLDADVVAPAEMADADHGDFTYVSGVATLDADVVGADEIADADYGDFTFSSGSATIDADSVALTTDTTGEYVKSVATTSPLSGGAVASEAATLTLTIADAAADDSTKGAATFEADDFDSATGKIDLADSVVKSITTDSGTATPSTHSFSILGGGIAATAGSTTNVTITATEADTLTSVTGRSASTTNAITVGGITVNGDTSLVMDAADEEISISQSNAAGTEDVPLIFINDDRTGATVDEVGEATIVIDAEGTYAMYVQDGATSFASGAYIETQDNIKMYDDDVFYQGGSNDHYRTYTVNGAGDSMLMSMFEKQNADDSRCWFWSMGNNLLTGDTSHDDYVSPTLVVANFNGADSKDYAGVVIGERTQSDVTAAHYFDFYAMTGAADGSVDATATELGATFRFGDSPAVGTYATGSGDVVFNDDVEVDGVFYSDDMTLGDTSITLTDTGSDGAISFKVDNTEALKLYSSGLIEIANNSGCITEASGTTVGTGAYTKLNLDTEVWDGHNELDIATNERFTCGQAGKYLVIINTGIAGGGQGVDQKVLYVMLYKNNAIVQLASIYCSGTGSPATMHAAIVSLAQNDYLEAFSYHEMGGDRTVWCYFSIFKIG